MHRVLVAMFVFGACGDDATRATVDAGPDVDAFVAPGFMPSLSIGATNGQITNPFSSTAHGTAQNFGGIDIGGAIGTVGNAPAFVYEQQDFGAYILSQGFAVDASSWDVFWIYCESGSIPGVYVESPGRSRLVYRQGSGTCATAGSTTIGNVVLPATTIGAPQPVDGFTVAGDRIHLEHGYGTIDGLPAVVFNIVDCTTSCGSPGWTELHLVLWDATRATATFAIAYLTMDDTTHVLLTYARSLPDLQDPIGDLTLAAAWNGVAPRGSDPCDREGRCVWRRPPSSRR